MYCILEAIGMVLEVVQVILLCKLQHSMGSFIDSSKAKDVLYFWIHVCYCKEYP